MIKHRSFSSFQADELLEIQKDLAVQLSHVSDLNQTLDTILHTVLKLSSIDAGGIYLVDPEDHSFHLKCHANLSAKFVYHAQFFPPESVPGQLALRGKPFYSQCEPIPKELIEFMVEDGLRCVTFLPIDYKNQIFGCVNLASHEIDEFISTEMDVLETIASQIGGAISRILAEQALKESEEKYRTLYESVNDSMYLIDQESGAILDVNSSASYLYGFSRDELLRMRNVDLSAEPEKTQSATLEFKPSVPLRMHKKKDGTIFPVEIRSGKFIYKGKPTLICVTRDISEQKQVESNLKKAKEEAEHANQEKGELLATISHEIKNPLSAILGHAELLEQQIKEPEFSERIQTILKSGTTVLKILNDILDLAKIESGKTTTLMQMFSLYSFFEGIYNLYKEEIQHQSLRFSMQLEDSVPSHIIHDELRLQQILSNLISNSLKFTKKGFIQVRCWFSPYSMQPKLGSLYIQVKDSGIGIQKEDIPIIFEPFQQLYPKIKNPSSVSPDIKSSQKMGTGLGLPICHKLLDRMNGTISVDSQYGQGTCVTIKIHLVQYVQQPSTPMNQPIKTEYGKETHEPTVVFFSNDENTITHDLIKDFFEDTQIHLLASSTIEAGLSVIKETLPSVIIMDFCLGYQSVKGYSETLDFAKSIKFTQDTQHIPIIGLTSTTLDLTSTSQDIPIFEKILSKPLYKKELVHWVHALHR